MATGVWAAFITSLTSLIVAAFSLVFQRKGAREEREEKRRSHAKVVLDKYRGPLLAAATDLGRRIHHIRHQNFVQTTSESGQDRQAKLTTLFRIAQYFGWCEILRTEVQLLRFEREHDTELVAKLIGDINWAFSSDVVDDRSRGSLWADEQRGVGELMVTGNEGSSSTCGYARFVDEYERCFASSMHVIAGFVLSKEAPDSHRLRLVQWGLLGLVKVSTRKSCERGTPKPGAAIAGGHAGGGVTGPGFCRSAVAGPRCGGPRGWRSRAGTGRVPRRTGAFRRGGRIRRGRRSGR